MMVKILENCFSLSLICEILPLITTSFKTIQQQTNQRLKHLLIVFVEKLFKSVKNKIICNFNKINHLSQTHSRFKDLQILN